MKARTVAVMLAGLLFADASLLQAADPTPIPAALLKLSQPADGATFRLGAEIDLAVQAVDPNGAITRVEFLADGEVIGVSEIVFIKPPLPGEPIEHRFAWLKAAAGKHSVSARAADSAGVVVQAAPITILVLGVPEQAIVEISAPDPEAAEGPDASGARNTGTFRFHRTGAVDRDLPVYYEVGGTAANGEDYVQLPGKVIIPQGAATVEVLVVPSPDRLVERTETVVVVIVPPICPAIYPPPPECYAVGAAARAEIKLFDGDATLNRAPSVKLLAPQTGAEFTAPGTITLKALADDPDGVLDLAKVEFFAGDRLLGEGQGVPPNPLWSGERFLVWTDPAPGEYRVHAEVTDRAGATGESEIAVITVRAAETAPVVTITATDPEAKEPTPERTEPNIGSFTVTRTGDAAGILKVLYAIAGTAANGVDYAELTGAVTFRAGATTERIDVLPLVDRLVEGTETVVLGLKKDPTYVVGRPAEARLSLLDATAPPNDMATLKITSPTNRTVVVAGTEVTVAATAVDPQGYISRVEFYAGDKQVGVSEIFFFVAPPPGTPIQHACVWKDVPVGHFLLTARAKDQAGQAVESAPVTLAATPKPMEGFVTRALPPTYTPGVAFGVALQATPPTATKAYAIEDAPPAGWQVSEISHEGVLDPVLGKVKFGPFFDAQERSLTYVVTPPTAASGVGEFVGLASADGNAVVIRGDTLVQAAPSRHPADWRAADNQVVITEVSAYGAAWKAGDVWPVGPNPIPADYVTRAAYLWRQGEVYHYDPRAGAPPLGWVPGKATLSSDDPTAPPSLNLGTASRAVIPEVAGDRALRVALRIQPHPANAAYAVEERLPEGWRLSAVDGSGSFDPACNRLKWGPFLDHTARELTYTIVPAQPMSSARFVGSACFDGGAVAIEGPAGNTVRGLNVTTGFGAAVRLAPDRVLVGLPVEATGTYAIESSTDLREWKPLATGVAADAVLSFVDERPGRPVSFYRARLLR